jgi:hypothetical protein
MFSLVKRFMTKRVNIAILATAAFLVIMASPFGSKAKAKPAAFVDNTYYNNASHSVEVGETIILCSGQRIHTGMTTIYFDHYEEPCD